MDFKKMIESLIKQHTETVSQLNSLNVTAIQQEAQIQLLNYLIQEINSEKVQEAETL